MSRNVRLVFWLLTTSLLALALIASSNPAHETVTIRIYGDGDYTVGPGQKALLQGGWSACSKGLTQDWVDAIDVSATLSFNGEVIQTIEGKEAAKHWTPVAQAGPDNTSYCLWAVDTLWRSNWRYDQLKLAKPGDYQLYLRTYLNGPVIDGGSSDDDERPDVWEGIFSESNISIHVLEQ